MSPRSHRARTIPLTIVHEDDALIVIDKPKGLVVHPAAGNATGTLVNALIAHCGASLSGIGGVKRPGIVHRLDKDTTGLMVVAKTDKAHRALSAQFADHGRTGDARAGVSGLRMGRAGPAERHDRCPARPPLPSARQAGDPPGRPRGRHPLGTSGEIPRDRRQAGREPAGVPAGDRPDASDPGASGPFRPSAARRRHLWPGLQDQGGPPAPKTPARRSKPLADRPCTPIYWASNTPKPATSCASSPASRATFQICGIPSRGVRREAASRPEGRQNLSEYRPLGLVRSRNHNAIKAL